MYALIAPRPCIMEIDPYEGGTVIFARTSGYGEAVVERKPLWSFAKGDGGVSPDGAKPPSLSLIRPSCASRGHR